MHAKYFWRASAYHILLFISFITSAYSDPDCPSTGISGAHSSRGTGFMENTGQVRHTDGSTATEVLFSALYDGVSVYLTRTGISYVFHETAKRMAHGQECEQHAPDDPCARRIGFNAASKLYRMDILFDGASRAFAVDKNGGQRGDYRYYYTRSKPPLVVRSFSTVTYRDIYPGISVRFVMDEKGLKYEFLVAPKADADNIRLRIIGADGIDLGNNGTLAMQTPLGTVHEQAPLSYEVIDAYPDFSIADQIHSAVQSKFVVNGNLLRFDVSRYNPDMSLVIDPFVEWSTYLGGADNESGNAAAFLPNGDVVVGGYTGSILFPNSPGLIQDVKDNYLDGFIARYSADGRRIWSTFIGGDIEDNVLSLAVDLNGDILAGGYTTSSNFPTTPGAFQEKLAGDLDAFILKIDDNGSLIWSTLFGGSSEDNLEGIVADSQGNIIITGKTRSSNLPRTAQAFQLVYAGNMDAYIAKFRPDGTRIWATYYGGNLEDWGHSVAVDRDNNIYACGHSHGGNFPTTPGSFQPLWRGDREGYLLKFAPDGTRTWATLIGDRDWDDTYDLAVDPGYHIAIVGGTASSGFPTTPNAFQPSLAARFDCIVMRFTGDGQLEWSSYAGGDDDEMFHSVGVYPSGNMMVAGFTHSVRMYTTPNAFQVYYGGPEADMYVMKIGAAGNRMYGTFLGGSGEDYRNTDKGLLALATSPRGQAVVTGRSQSYNFPVLNADQPDTAGLWDVTVTKFNCTVSPTPIATAGGPTSFCDGDSVILSIPEGYNSYVWSTGDSGRTLTVKVSGIYIASVSNNDDCVADTPPIVVTVYPSPRPAIVPSGPTTFCDGDSVVLDAGDGFTSYQWSNGKSSRFITITASGVFDVSVIDSHGCSGSSAPLTVTVNPLPQPVASAQGPTSFCEGASVVLDAGAGYLSYRWSNGDTTQTTSITTSGSYTVTVVNQFGCSATSPALDVTVFPLPQPVITPLGPTSICAGDSVMLDAGAGYSTYQWSTGGNARLITVSAAGQYTVTVTDANGCQNTSPAVDIIVNDLPTSVITANGPTEFCSGLDVVLDAGAGYKSYIWSTGDTSRTITAQMGGSYFVIVESAEGCMGTSPPIDVTVYPAPAADVVPPGPISFCEGDSILLTAISGYTSYRWSTGETDSSIFVSQSGNYRVIITNEFGCIDTSNIVEVTVYPNPPKPVITQSRDTLTSTTADAYIWYLNGNEIIGENGQTMLIPQAGTYTVAAVSVYGCLTLSDPFPVTIASMTVSLPDLIADPGTHLVIPLTVETSDLFIESGAKNFIATVRFEKNILAAVAPASGWSSTATEHSVRLNGTWSPGIPTLGAFEVMTMLGAMKSVPLVIDSLEWLEGIVAVTKINGSVTLNICEEGGERLFDASGTIQLAQNRPNPFNGETSIEYELIERGQTQLFITDLIGRRVATLLSGLAEPGTYEARFEAGDLPSGRYFAVLQTPTGVRVLLMHHVK